MRLEVRERKDETHAMLDRVRQQYEQNENDVSDIQPLNTLHPYTFYRFNDQTVMDTKICHSPNHSHTQEICNQSTI